MSLTRGRQGYKSPGTADTMLSNGGWRSRATVSPLDMAGSPGCYTSRDAHSLCFTGTVAASVPSMCARARLHDHCDLISAQIDGQTTVINPDRWPAARLPGVQSGGLSETSSCWYLNVTLPITWKYLIISRQLIWIYRYKKMKERKKIFYQEIVFKILKCFSIFFTCSWIFIFDN